MGLSFKYEDTFAGCIIPGGDTTKTWDFMLADADFRFDKTAGCGLLKDGNRRDMI